MIPTISFLAIASALLLAQEPGPGVAKPEWKVQINKTVGQVCVHLVDSHLEPYSALGGPGSRFSQRSRRPPNYFAHFKLGEPKTAHEWWETRKEKSLKELQIEVLEWVISEEEKLAGKYTDNDRDSMRKKLGDLRMQDNPIPPAYLFAP